MLGCIKIQQSSENLFPMLSFRSLSAKDFPLLLTWLCAEHVKQWWNDGDDTLEKVALHYGEKESDVARFILIKSVEAEERPIGHFQYYIVSIKTQSALINSSEKPITSVRVLAQPQSSFL
jgi:hypothetical protein